MKIKKATGWMKMFHLGRKPKAYWVCDSIMVSRFSVPTVTSTAISDGLQQPLGSHAVGSKPVLDPRCGFTFQQNQIGNKAQEHLQDDQGNDDLCDQDSVHAGATPFGLMEGSV